MQTILSLMWKFLKARYIEQWEYHKTYSGTPQGSGMSPILANIYLSELDTFMENTKVAAEAAADDATIAETNAKLSENAALLAQTATELAKDDAEAAKLAAYNVKTAAEAANTEYALEQMFSIIDSRYRCNKR